jgi:signal transduction histidine kinase
LKNTLTAILSNAQAGLRFLNHEPLPKEEVRAILDDIATSDRRASEIINRLRAMMKKEEAEMEPRDINADIEQSLQLLHSDLVARNVEVSMVLATGLPLVNGDHIQLQQVMLNLVVNGCDAMQQHPSESRSMLITTRREGNDMVRVSVADSGTGIPPELEERIFEPFCTTKDQGLGMGLSICRAIIERHGGQLWAENNAGCGATFYFTLKSEGGGGAN